MTDADMQKMADELAIRRVLDEYCLRLEVNPFEEWLDLFTEDTVYDVFRHSLRGRKAVAAMLSQAPHGVHIPGASRIDVEGGHWSEAAAEPAGHGFWLPVSTNRYTGQ